MGVGNLRALVALSAVTLAAAGCASGADSRSSTSSPTGTRIITGVVLRAPTCPVERAGSPCPPAPAADAQVAAFSGATRAAVTTTDDRGRFRLTLRPGSYDLVATSAGPLRTTAQTHVRLGTSPVNVRLTVDSSIR